MEMKTCKTCCETKEAADFYPNKTARDGGNICRACKRGRDARYRDRNREKVRKAARRHAAANREKIRARSKVYRDALRLEVISAYGGRCACCGEAALPFLTIDHIDGGGTEHRRRTHNKVYTKLRQSGFPSGYRVLCWNCNAAIGLYGRCPHEGAS